MDMDFPDRFGPAFRITVINLVWILPLIALERAAEGHARTAAVFGVLWLVDLAVAVMWAQLGSWLAGGRRKQVGWILITLGALFMATGAYLLLTAPTNVEVQAEKSSATLVVPPPPEIVAVPPAPATPAPAPPAPTPLKPAPIFWWFQDAIGAHTEPQWLFSIAESRTSYMVTGFEIQGRNKGDVHLTDIRAQIISKNSGQKLVLGIRVNDQWVDPSKTLGIAPEAYFKVGGPLPDGVPQMTVEQFLETVGGFAFEFECGELPLFRREFSYSDIRDRLTKAKRDWEERTRPIPEVKLKDK